MTIPNFITIARLVIVPMVIAMMLQGNWQTAFFLFVLAGISDGLDGFIARQFNMRSNLGAYLDPLADKALLVSIYVTLAIIGVLPPWFAVIVVFRDLAILAAVILSWVIERPVAIRPVMISKLNTAAQIGYAAALLAVKAFGLGFGMLDFPLMIVVALLTISSAAVYLSNWLRHMAG